MGDRTGLGPLETAVLRAVASVEPDGDGWARCDALLDRLEGGIGYCWPIVQHLAVPWRLHLPLLERDGNMGFWNDERGPADPEYVRVRLSRTGSLALLAENSDLGAMPLGLIEGTAYKGGWRPSFDPERIVDALRGLLADGDLEAAAGRAGLPLAPSGSTLRGDLGALLRGEHMQFSRLTETSPIHHERADGRDLLVLTGLPIGVGDDEATLAIIEESQRTRSRIGPDFDGWMADLRDESTNRIGIRIVVVLRRGVDVAGAERWLCGIRPVSVDVRRELPAPIEALLNQWAAAIRPDPSGLHALAALL